MIYDETSNVELTLLLERLRLIQMLQVRDYDLTKVTLTINGGTPVTFNRSQESNYCSECCYWQGVNAGNLVVFSCNMKELQTRLQMVIDATADWECSYC